ncbi:SCO-spondin-like isoform X2 [Haliotis cracherodii]|uniref:SCO-spondin-like isoform X2 n=1 Tax=Haliotis cracherodii TaxID=6455 RepID=UPI0039E76E36
MTSPQQYLIVAGYCLIISLQVTYQQNVFQQSLTDTNVDPGSFGNLVLQVSPGITDAGQWFKDGVELFDIPGKLQIAVSGQLRQLVIFNILVSDTGRYSFSLRGQTTSAFLTVGDVVVGVWGEWTQWSGPPCPATCGPTATHAASRSRSCSFENSCAGEGSQSEMRSCAPACGAVNGNWGEWTQWSGPPCSATCGPTARRTLSRSRSCNNPAPRDGGAPCSGETTQSQNLECGPASCAPSIFKVGLSSESRAVGEQVLFQVEFIQSTATSVIGTWRKNDVVIANGGNYIIASAGSSQYLYITNLQVSDSGRYSYTFEGETTAAQLTVGSGPINGNWGAWGQWSGPPCPATCGPTARHTASRIRSCNNPAPSNGGATCSGDSGQSGEQQCGPSVCVSTWNNWGQWIDSSCPATCGVDVTQTATRSRTCNQQAGQPFCSGSSTDSEVRVCSLPLCPVNGNWAQWSQWSGPSCSVTCGPTARRTITRSRSCSNPPPSNGGANCPGQATETNDLSCGPSTCETVTSTWNNWGQWIDSSCPATCGVGVTQTATRSRTCNQPSGQPFCSGSSTDFEVRECSLSLCPVNGNWGGWSQWSDPPCSATCGPAARRTLSRTRFCNNPAPSNGGADCPGQATGTNEVSCGPSICVQSTWNNWGQWVDPGCPATCGVGVTRTATRSRTCNQPSGQPFCSGSSTDFEVRACSLPLCPVNGNWAQWSQWSGPSCSVTCGPTARRTITRSRSCSNPPPSNGGASCPGQAIVTDAISCGPSTCETVTSTWNNWGQWFDPGCSASCGVGVTRTATRSRTCNQPSGQPFCSGSSTDSEVRACSLPLCPVNGNWGQWSQWTDPSCPASCGPTARRTIARARSCDNPAPSNGGVFCAGLARETQDLSCGPSVCVQSTWNNWGQWIDSRCPTTCGVGVTQTATRSRTCNQQAGQPFCSGSSTDSEVRVCSLPLCPVQSTWNNWGQWIDSSCPATCGVGVTQTATRSRTCNQQAGQPFCSGSSTDSEVRVCSLPLCPVNGNWAQWSQWSGPSCSVTCGPTARRTITRSRFCTDPPPSNGGATCPGQAEVTDAVSCGPSTCETVTSTWNNWGQWVDPGCSVSCGADLTRTATRSRTCNQQAGQPFCSGSSTDSEVRVCSLPLCPVNGNWGQWSQWTDPSCPATCGPTARRTVSRTRSCENPAPSNGGVFCAGLARETQDLSCGPSVCANITIDGGFSQWSIWRAGQCSVRCGDGLKTDTRTRSCTEPTPQNGGLPCAGPATENRTAPCTVTCVESAWSTWIGPSCPSTCGRHVTITQERSRTCRVLNPSGSDSTCGVSLRETRNFTCVDILCPVDGGFSPWGVWVTYNVCTGTCERELKTLIRTRSCNNPTPAFNGRTCQGDTLQQKQDSCVVPVNCTGSAVNGNWGEWTSWGGPSCPATCGPTARHTVTRARSCNNPPPRNAGATCPGDNSEMQTRDCGAASVCETAVSWSEWGQWVNTGCGVTCGVGVKWTSARTRTCDQKPGQPTCPGNNTQSEVKACDLPVCQGVIYSSWSEWSQWSSPLCSASCGPAARHTVIRTRFCTDGTDCPGEGRESQNRSCGNECPTTGAATQTGTILLALVGAVVSLCLM